MYQVGDRVVHPMHGAGIIESIVQERLGGQLGSYYVFRMPSGGLTLKIPTGSCGAIGVRALSTSGRIREVLSAIRRWGSSRAGRRGWRSTAPPTGTDAIGRT